MSESNPLLSKYQGSLIGLAMGDTLGTVAEFMDPGEFEPITKPRAGGPFNLPLGYWTDDTSMALCLADSLIEKDGYDSYDVMDKYWSWRAKGYRSSTGVCFDIGNQTSTVLNEYMSVGGAIISKDIERLTAAGNGSIMRLAPIIIATHGSGNSLEETMKLAQISGRETHYSLMAEAGTALFGALIYNAFTAADKSDIFEFGDYPKNQEFEEIEKAILSAKDQNEKTLSPTGYVLDSLVCALWAFMNFDDFESGALAAVNLGGDSDTIGAIYGQLAGAYYGADGIPQSWRDVLLLYEEMMQLAKQLSELEDFRIIRTRFEEDDSDYAINPEIESIQGDITLLDVDAIVNAANTELFGGSGVCGAIFDAAGYEEMTEACQKIGGCEYGEAVITPGFNLAASHVIHTVGPIYGQHDGNERDILKSCYWQSLRLAQDNRIRSIAFPFISTGIYGYPKEEAIGIAVDAIKQFYEDNLQTSVERVVLVGFDQNDYDLINRYIESI